MFLRLATQYRDVVTDLVMSLQALAESLRRAGVLATCYLCGDGTEGASLVVDLQDGHAVRFLVSESGIRWVEMRHGIELVNLDGAEAIQELDRLSTHLHSLQQQRQSAYPNLRGSGHAPHRSDTHRTVIPPQAAS
ncbi:MAG: DUF1815 family protein [Synechococcus sp.]